MYRNQMNFQVFEAKFLQIQLSTDIQLFFFFLISVYQELQWIEEADRKAKQWLQWF